MILVEKFNCFHRLFVLKIGPEMMFGDVLDREEAFLDNKKMYLICPKKNRPFFIVFFFIENRPRNDVWGCST